MPSVLQSEHSVVLKFGGGVHSRASEDDIDDRECSTGQNFQLDPQNKEFKNRAAFDLLGTVPNASELFAPVRLPKRSERSDWALSS